MHTRDEFTTSLHTRLAAIRQSGHNFVMNRRITLVGGLALAALGVLLLGLESARNAAALERARHRRAIDDELGAAAGLAAAELRTQIRLGQVGSLDPLFPAREYEMPADDPSSRPLTRARALELTSPGAATQAYLGVILDTEIPDEESAARRAIARMLMRDDSKEAALETLRRAIRVEATSPAEQQRVRQAMAHYDRDRTAADVEPPHSFAEAAARLQAAVDPDQLVLTRDGEVAWRKGDHIVVARLPDLLGALLPGFADGRWRTSDSGAGRALPAPFPRIWLAPREAYLATAEGPATRLRNAYALPTILGTLVLAAAAVASWIALGRQQRFEERRNAFLCAVTHELKTPIANISLYGELLRDHGRDDPERIESFADVVMQEAERLGLRVQELLDVASGRRPLPSADGSFDLVAVIAEVVEEYRSRAYERKIEVELPEAPGRARGGAALFRRAIDGILSNAVRFAPIGTIRVRLREENSGWTLLVDDEGPGIPAAEREHVFEAFVRLNNPLNSGIDGTGLGLTLVRQCINECGGTVAIEATSAGGARVRVAMEGAA